MFSSILSTSECSTSRTPVVQPSRRAPASSLAYILNDPPVKPSPRYHPYQVPSRSRAFHDPRPSPSPAQPLPGVPATPLPSFRSSFPSYEDGEEEDMILSHNEQAYEPQFLVEDDSESGSVCAEPPASAYAPSEYAESEYDAQEAFSDYAPSEYEREAEGEAEWDQDSENGSPPPVGHISGPSGTINQPISQSALADGPQELDSEEESEEDDTSPSNEEVGAVLSTPFAPGPGNPLFDRFETMEEELDIEALPALIPETSPLRRKAAFWTHFPFANTDLLDLLTTGAEPEQDDQPRPGLNDLVNNSLLGMLKQTRKRGEPLEDEQEGQRPAKRARVEDAATSPSASYSNRVHIKSSMGKRTYGAGTRH